MKVVDKNQIRFRGLSNLQVELLSLYQTDLDEETLADMRTILKDYFARKAIAEADKAWDEKNYSDDEMDRIIGGDQYGGRIECQKLTKAS